MSLHSYRYAWAERAYSTGYEERFAQSGLGHGSLAVHREYSRDGVAICPPLESYENKTAIREEIALIAKTIETRDLNITNHAAKTDELCKITIAKCNETVASVELMVKNLGAHMDVKAVVQGIQAALDKGIKAEIISPFIQHSKELEKQVLPTLKEIKEASTVAHTLWMKHIWKTAWTGAFTVTLMFFGLATLGIYHFFDHYAERKAAEQVAEVSRLMNYNQEAFRELAVAQIPLRVQRVANNDGSAISQKFAVVIQDADAAEMRDDDGHHNGLVFVTSHSTEDEIQQLQQVIDKLMQTTNSDAK